MGLFHLGFQNSFLVARIFIFKKSKFLKLFVSLKNTAQNVHFTNKKPKMFHILRSTAKDVCFTNQQSKVFVYHEKSQDDFFTIQDESILPSLLYYFFSLPTMY